MKTISRFIAILSFVFILIFPISSIGQDDFYIKKAEGYHREAEYYQKKADGYRNEAEYYLKKAERYQREASY